MKEKRKFVKLHIVADKIVGFRVTSEMTGDTKKFVPMVREVARKRKVAEAYADGAYDSRKLQPPQRIWDRASHQAEEGSEHPLARLPLRRQEVLLLNRVGYDGWKTLKDYGKTWMAEIVFSAFKGVLGGALMARRFLSQKAEVALKVMLYNRFMSL